MSIVIPCRDEERFLDGCLGRSLRIPIHQSLLEILIVDSMSTDQTRTINETVHAALSPYSALGKCKTNYSCRHEYGHFCSRVEIILKADAHSTYPPNYIEGCVRQLDFKADMAGGCWSLLRADTHIARSISVALSLVCIREMLNG